MGLRTFIGQCPHDSLFEVFCAENIVNFFPGTSLRKRMLLYGA